ncbi:MAG TPA: ferritin-like domain-containing protein [Stellaceae bacterium]|nr:ferritin-like domain-containing protein [Stellaceae bacterium]
MLPDTLTRAAVAVLAAPEPARKIALSHDIAMAWRAGALSDIGRATPPDRPARPERPRLLPPREMPKRRAGGERESRVALLHALAHIELNAIDLAWDLIARFAGEAPLRAFFDDWITVADEEAVHHRLLAEQLATLGALYGDLPAHDGLWEVAAVTSGDFLARLAVVPLVLEARGLDVTPAMIGRLERAGDPASAAVLRRIYADEIAHVAAGRRWFEWACARDGLPPAETYHDRVRRYFKGALKPPFNEDARSQAGLPAAFYAPLACQAPETAAEWWHTRGSRNIG